jgi:vesicle-fusing ATPase
MNAIAAFPQRVLLNPDLGVPDPCVAWWLDQVTLRLRREVAWCWHLRGDSRQAADGVLPPFTDPTVESLDLTRHIGDKRRFFATDVAARHLSERMTREPRPALAQASGSWDWLARQAGLDEAAQFVLALTLAARLDAALGPVFASCHNDASRPYPTLALAQRLWDEPRAVAACCDFAHPLYRFGLLTVAANGHEATDWTQPLDLPAMLVGALTDPAGYVPAALAPAAADGRKLPDSAFGLAAELAAVQPTALQLVPLLGRRGSNYVAWASALAGQHGRRVVTLAANLPPHRSNVQAVLALCWLRDVDLVVPDAWQERANTAEPWFAGALTLPVRCYVPVGDGAVPLPAGQAMPPFHIPALGYADRLAGLDTALGACAAALDGTVRDAARRFRLDEMPLTRVMRTLQARVGVLNADELIAVCRAEAGGGMGTLAQPVEPRFALDELVLPPRQTRQLETIATSTRSLARVH